VARKRKQNPDQLGLLEARVQTAPCVPAIRAKIKAWRDDGYKGVTDTTRLLLNYWFATDHRDPDSFLEGIGIVRKNLFWLSDEQWGRIEARLPTDVRGVDRVDDRRVISGIIHVLKSGCRWRDCPPEYGPPTTIYNRFVRWARRGVWENLFRELAGNGRSTDTQMIDSTHVKAHRSAAGGKGGSKSRLLAVRAEGATRRFTHLQMLKGALSPSC
jgi:transposase